MCYCSGLRPRRTARVTLSRHHLGSLLRDLVHQASVGAGPPRPGLCVHDRLACTESLRTSGRYVDGLLIRIRRSRLRRRGSPLGIGEFLGGRRARGLLGWWFGLFCGLLGWWFGRFRVPFEEWSGLFCVLS